MRLVILVLTLGSLSVGCAIQAGDPSTEEPQRHDEIVAVSGSARPITPVAGPMPTGAPGATQHSGNVLTGALPATAPGETSGATIQADNPNPSPWDPHGNAGGP